VKTGERTEVLERKSGFCKEDEKAAFPEKGLDASRRTKR